jgi:VCBS repeat-containing protein
VNDAPVTANDSFTTDEDASLAGSVLANDTDVDSTLLRAILVSAPANGALTLSADGSFSYVPAANFNGTDGFTYQLNDGVADSSTATVAIVIRSVNDAPVASNQSVTTERKRAVALTLTARDQEGNALTYRIVRGPVNGTLSGTGPTLAYTPKKNFIGADSFTFVATDGVADSNIATVSITVVKDLNDPPVAFDQSVQTDEGKSKDIELRAKDPDGNQLRYVMVSSPSHGTLSGSGKRVTYTPGANFHGQDRFTFRVSDAVHESNVATVTITVRLDDDDDDDDDDDQFTLDVQERED